MRFCILPPPTAKLVTENFDPKLDGFRLSVAPMSRITAMPDGRATGTMTRYYERFAKGGFGTVITEGIYTDQAFSQGYVD